MSEIQVEQQIKIHNKTDILFFLNERKNGFYLRREKERESTALKRN